MTEPHEIEALRAHIKKLEQQLVEREQIITELRAQLDALSDALLFAPAEEEK